MLAIGLAVVAGFVDALGFLELGGMFVSFMSGNSTQLAVGLASPAEGRVFAGALIAAFVSGVMGATALGSAAGSWRKQVVLASMMLVITLASLANRMFEGIVVATLLMAAAMGAANAIFQRDGEVSVGVTYMTGTLVKFGQHLAGTLAGGARYAWLPYLLLWLGLILGALTGTALYPLFGLQALWIAVAFSGLLLAISVPLGPLPEA